MPQTHLNVFCLYRPPPNKKNKLTDVMFLEEFSGFLEYANELNGSLLIVGDFNYHFDVPSGTYTSKIIDMLNMFDLSQHVAGPTHVRGHTVDWVLSRNDNDSLVKSCTVLHTLASDHFCVYCD
jgi:endonuclease/exonuclease/phosphatase (EEP) superfamily protein YafD